MSKKLIEVTLPLEAINAEAAREKSIRHGHPSTLHLWWARRPLAAARAVIWSSLVDDPSAHPELYPTEETQNAERQRLFTILEKLVKWENSNDPEVLDAAKAEILRSTNNNPPALLDPFAGGGAIPLEAQRLGLEAHAHDLNPVAVMINKAMIEIPPRFAGQPPVNPDSCAKLDAAGGWKGAQGLAADVQYYGEYPGQISFTLETLDIRPGGFPPPSRYSFRHSLFLKIHSSLSVLLHLFKNAPLPMYNYIPKLRCCVLAPDIFGAGPLD